MLWEDNEKDALMPFLKKSRTLSWKKRTALWNKRFETKRSLESLRGQYNRQRLREESSPEPKSPRLSGRISKPQSISVGKRPTDQQLQNEKSPASPDLNINDGNNRQNIDWNLSLDEIFGFFLCENLA
ncbi:hypothetical protein N7471_013441 [Penicillium samsonianum]|uniref:uncharacterized protein n=1 Tax=Penicillium samsonianum TaxID=1882272 RepID=UPI00254903A9|nr:uncharacterized protein N7471_013441 [Penicillium samsonianum]KAJ6118821.1 hypothetical protein N7471_013441 [Penicillium samsonianum]